MFIVTVTFWFAACKEDNNEPAVKAYLPTEKPSGKSYAEWTVLWWQEMLKTNCTTNPWLNPDKVLFYETGPVYFLAGIAQNGGSVNVTIPQDKALLFPLVNYINDYPCPDPNFEPAAGQTLTDFLTQGAKGLEGVVTNMKVTVDDTEISNLEAYFFVTDLFYFTGDPALASCFDGCITGSSQPAVGSGFYVMVKPLSKGSHTIHYHMSVPVWPAVQDGTFNVTVQ